jgi:hypothetical protein
VRRFADDPLGCAPLRAFDPRAVARREARSQEAIDLDRQRGVASLVARDRPHGAPHRRVGRPRGLRRGEQRPPRLARASGRRVVERERADRSRSRGDATDAARLRAASPREVTYLRGVPRLVDSRAVARAQEPRGGSDSREVRAEMRERVHGHGLERREAREE